MHQSTFLERLRVLYQALGLLVILAVFVLALASLPELARRLRDAKDADERAYYALDLASTWCYIYPLTMIVLLAIAPDGLQDIWPTVSWVILDWDMSHSKSVMLDIAISLLMCGPLLLARSWYGSTSASGEYRPPERKLADEHIEDVMNRYRAVLDANPALDPSWPSLRKSQKIELEREFAARLAGVEDRVRTVHAMWHRRCPI